LRGQRTGAKTEEQDRHADVSDAWHSRASKPLAHEASFDVFARSVWAGRADREAPDMRTLRITQALCPNWGEGGRRLAIATSFPQGPRRGSGHQRGAMRKAPSRRITAPLR
jgi:hypothetical protein